MTTASLKNNLHLMIDSIDNKTILERFYELLYKVKNTETGTLWRRLSEEEQNELIQADIESENPDNLIQHSDIQKKHNKWLRK
jgi:DNA-binding HxlR family transcriptional regulator